MLFPKNFFAVTDFDKLISILQKYCNSDIGKNIASNLELFTDANIINDSHIIAKEAIKAGIIIKRFLSSAKIIPEKIIIGIKRKRSRVWISPKVSLSRAR